MLTSIVFLFNMTLFSGKDDDDHLQRAQRALATMQECTRPPPQHDSAPANGGGDGASDGRGAAAAVVPNGAAAPDAEAAAAPSAAATFVRFCTASYAICMGCMQDAVGILRQALRDAPLPEALAEANSPNGAALGRGLQQQNCCVEAALRVLVFRRPLSCTACPCLL